MPNAADLVDLVLRPSLEALREIDAEAAKERHRRMVRSPADFVRGSLVLHVSWLAAHPLPDAPWVWSVGDLHTGNLATLATGPLNRAGISPVTYGVADVDDEHPAPWHWDLVRLLASMGFALLLKGGLKRGRFRELASAGVADYVRVMRAAMDGDEHAERMDFHGLPEALKTTLAHDADDEVLRAHIKAMVNGRRLRPGKQYAVDDQAKRLLLPAIEDTLRSAPPATEWQLLDLARRTTSGGLASLGRRRWWVLAQERSRGGAWVPRVLELKERRPSVLSAILPAQPFMPLTTNRWTLPMGGDRWQCAVPIGVGDALLRTRCQARTVLDVTTFDDGDLLRLVRLWGQVVAVAHLTSARGLGQSATRQAAAVVTNAQQHASEVARLAWKLIGWTRDAYRAYRKTA